MKMDILKDKKSKDSSRLNIHFGKIILIMLLILGQVFTVNFSKVEATGNLYYYDKYYKTPPSTGGVSTSFSVETSSIWYYYDDDHPAYEGYTEVWEASGHTSPIAYTNINGESYGIYTVTSTHYNLVKHYSGHIHEDARFSTRWIVIAKSVSTTSLGGGVKQYSYNNTQLVYAVHGGSVYEFSVGENLVLPSTYPINGLHTDGFWYVRKGLANTSPTITSLISGGVVSGGNSYFSKINQA